MPGQPGDQPAELQALLPGFQLFFGAAVDEFGADGRPALRQPDRHAAAGVAGAASPPALAGRPDREQHAAHVHRGHAASPELGPLRVMTTHLEYYSPSQRLAQARALRALHLEACEQAAAPPVDP